MLLAPFSTFLVMPVDERQAIDVVLAAGHDLAFLSISYDRAIESMSERRKNRVAFKGEDEGEKDK
jgi:hypothetical protein